MCPSRTEALKVARGAQQRQFVHALYSGSNPRSYAHDLRGRARIYWASYARSFDALLERLTTAGVPIKRTPGPRGGLGSSTYALEEDCHVAE